MGEYAAIAAIITAAASAGTAVVSAQAAQQQGKVARQQAELQAQAYAEQRQAVADAAGQEEANRLAALRRTLGAAAALRGARGLASDSVGAGVLDGASRAEAERDLDNILVNSEREGRMLGLAGSRALLAGSAAETDANSRAMAGYSSALSSTVRAGNAGYKYLSSLSGGTSASGANGMG
jgi:hypothetical protein